MNKYGIFTPIPAKMTMEPGQEGYIKRLESAFKNANYNRDGLFVIQGVQIESAPSLDHSDTKMSGFIKTIISSVKGYLSQNRQIQNARQPQKVQIGHF